MRYGLMMAVAGVMVGFADAAVDESPASMDEQIEWVTVGDPGNPAYPGLDGVILADRGSVDYTFRVSRTEITSGQWIQFVNKFGTMSDELGDLLRTGLWPAYPDFSYDGPGQRYVFSNNVLEPELAPVGISWRQAAMFCNWMHNGCTDDPESLFNGVYDTSTFTRNDDNTYNDQDTHFPDARYWIVTLDEYLKAAYYDPDKNGQGPGWWEFGHSSDDPPVYGVPGVGDVARELSDEELIRLCGLPNHGDLPLGLYPESQSPWGLLDVLGGNSDFVEDWEPANYRRARARKLSANAIFGDNEPFDRIWMLITIPPRSSLGSFHIASLPRPRADLNRDWLINFFDVAQFLLWFLDGDLRADLRADGLLDADDVRVFLGLYMNM